MPKSRSFPSRARKRWVPLTALAVGTVIVGGLVAAAFATQPSASDALPGDWATPTATAEAPVDDATVATTPTSEAVARLSKKDQPWAVTVIGDSTGNDGDEWVWIAARELSSRYNRPVDINTWDMAAGAYQAPARIGKGSTTPITIWNAASPGAEPQYSLDNLAVMTANPSDMLIINHGHNFVTPAGGTGRVRELIEQTAGIWNNQPAVSVVLQNPRTTEAAVQDANLAALRTAFEGVHTIVDVEAAWRGKDIATLLRDGTHPNEAGSALWADAAKTAMGW